MNGQKNVSEVLQALGHKPLNKAWAKIEIFLGLACVFLGLLCGVAPMTAHALQPFGLASGSSLLSLVIGMALFVLGGYLAMAGNRSHLYQSSNATTALLTDEIRRGRSV